jgi:acetyltransferase-like isoleucine patch superfamily enzyme/vacuolar-type H+-ATPase subunit F/Vma7
LDASAQSVNPTSSRSKKAGLGLYIQRQADGWGRYLLEQLLYFLFGWIPGVVGIGLRAIFYRLILKMNGWAAIESGVRLRFASNIRLGHGAYLDQGVYLHACPNGIEIGSNTIVMHGAVLHVYNFRGMPQSGIHIGRDSLIGEYSIIRGQGGVSIGNRVYTSPFTQLLAVNHIFDDPNRPFTEQGITAKGITVEDDVWLGAGAILTDGVRVGQQVPSGVVYVDGLAVGDLGQVVLRDRQMLSSDGIALIVVALDARTGAVVGDVEFVTRGLVIGADTAEAIKGARTRIDKVLKRTASEGATDQAVIKKALHDAVSQYVWETARRRPMIIPIVMEV